MPCLCYRFAPPNLPSHCVCGKDFSVSHAFSCPHGAFPILCHNDVRELTVKLLSKVCHDVQVVPHLQPLCEEVLLHCSAVVEDDARVDIRAPGFWRCSHHKTFLTYVFSTVLIAPQPLLQLFIGMRVRSTMPMRSVFANLSIVASLLWFFPVCKEFATEIGMWHPSMTPSQLDSKHSSISLISDGSRSAWCKYLFVIIFAVNIDCNVYCIFLWLN